MERVLILFAHGARDPAWAGPVEAVARKLQSENPDREIRIAFLEFMVPSLPEVMDTLGQRDQNLHVDILPFFIAQGGHLRQEVPEMLAQIQHKHPKLQLRLLPPLGELPAVQEAMATAISRLL